MERMFYLFLFVLILQTCFAPPVSQNKKEGEQQEESEISGLEDYMEYHRYLKEIVNALESDPEFRKKLEKADENDIKSGKIADELEFVSHHVRTRLDEIKRVELERLRDLVEKKRQLENGGNSLDDPNHHHLDHSNPHTFEIEDLKKLIAKTTEDLAKADKRRKEEFKQYELEKEYRKQEKLNHTNGAEREKLEKEFEEMEEKHKKHEKLHEPGHKAQLEEVWEEQDQMQQDFDPKTFFMLHDIDGNGLWDQEEVKALFIKELDKMYQQGAPEDDMRERIEEMERMRESVFNEIDKNRDGFIDFNEFLQQTNSNDFKQDHGWQALDEQKPYTDEELAEYVRQHQQYNQIPQGYPQPHVPYQQIPPGAYQQVPHGGYHPNAVPPQGQQFYPGQVPQNAPLPDNHLNTNEVYLNQHQQPNYQANQHQQAIHQANQQQGHFPPQGQNGQPSQQPNNQQYYQQGHPPQAQGPQQVQHPQVQAPQSINQEYSQQGYPPQAQRAQQGQHPQAQGAQQGQHPQQVQASQQPIVQPQQNQPPQAQQIQSQSNQHPQQQQQFEKKNPSVPVEQVAQHLNNV